MKNSEYLNGIATYRRTQLYDIHTKIMFLKVMNVIKFAAVQLLRISELDFSSLTALYQSEKGEVCYQMV